MKCNKCNSEIPLDAKFCPNCGNKIDEDILKNSKIGIETKVKLGEVIGKRGK